MSESQSVPVFTSPREMSPVPGHRSPVLGPGIASYRAPGQFPYVLGPGPISSSLSHLEQPIQSTLGAPVSGDIDCTENRSLHRSNSSKSSTKAKRMAAEARHAMEILKIAEEREQLAQIKLDAQNKILAAELAAIESSSKSKSNSVLSWVHSVRENNELPAGRPPVPEAVGPMVVVGSTTEHDPKHTTAAATQSDPVSSRISPKVTFGTSMPGMEGSLANNNIHSSTLPLNTITAPSSSHHCEGFRDLAAAIVSLSQKPKSLTLPPFSGKAIDWIAFKQAYVQTFSSFSPLENLARIRSALCGEALVAVSSLSLTAQHPDDVIGALEERFGRPELIVLEELAAVRALPRLQTDLKDLNVISCKVHNLVSILKHLGQVEYLYSPEIYNNILLKLTPLLRVLWTRYAAEHPGNISKIELLSNFLRNESTNHIRFGLLLQQNFPFNKCQNNNHNNSNDRKCQVLVTEVTDTCRYCHSQNHGIKLCESFKAIPVDQRVSFLKKNKICFKCLSSKTHLWRHCSKNKICGVDNCRRQHHPLLHGANIFPSSSSSPTFNVATVSIAPERVSVVQDINKKRVQSVDSDSANHRVEQPTDKSYNCSLVSSKSRKVLLKIIPVVVRGPRGEIETFALLDDGSTATLIDSCIANEIGLHGRDGFIRIQGVSGMSCEEKVQYVSFQIRGKYKDEFYSIENARVICNLALSKQTVDLKDVEHSYLHDIHNDLIYEDAKPMVLIGAEDWPLILSQAVKSGTRNQPVASLTTLGWVLHGVSSSKTRPIEFINNVKFEEPSLDNLEQLIREQFKLDALGITKRPTACGPQHNRALEILEKTTSRLPNGRFQAGLLWREDNPYIPDSYDQARSRFISLERKMSKDHALADAYEKFINDILKKGFARECEDSYYSRIDKSKRIWYLPHFAVFHPQKKKIRVVHDAAARTDGVSLNNLLLPGPDLLPSLLGILFRWRQGRVAMIGDIKEMFPQVKIIEQDQNMQRFLWRARNCTGPIKEFKMTSMIFGAASSPCTALYVLRKNAQEHEAKFPDAADTIRNTYMDDCVISVNSVSQAAHLVSRVIEMHSLGHFEMRGWVSNVPEALNAIPTELRANTTTPVSPLDCNISSACRVLGLVWDVSHDTLMFQGTKSNNIENLIITKRAVLSYAMSLYDPLGILSPLTIHGRILLQKAWRSGVTWDQPLPTDLVSEWRLWIEKILQLNIKIPRCYVFGFSTHFDQAELELHVFADASELAYACVAYWRITKGSEIMVSFIAAKARVTPLKPVSIPRLELQGALLATRLAATIESEHDVTASKRFFWIDSMNVLGWLRAEARSLKPFVANRVGEISETTEISEWKWIPTSLNVADEATRKSPSVSPRWLSGPSFLLEHPESWPLESTSKQTSLINDEYIKEFKSDSLKIHATIDQNSSPRPSSISLAADPSRFSSWLRMVRVTARAHQFIKNIRNHLNSKNGSHNYLANSSKRHNHSSSFHQSLLPPLDSEDMSKAELDVIRRSQAESFHEELQSLRLCQPVSRQSRISRLSPLLDTDGVIRIAGRISATSDVPTSLKEPIILDGRHRAVKLLVIHYHKKAAHGLNEMVINELRQRFWILRLRNLVRSVSQKCSQCVILRSKPVTPPMGDLPPERLAHHRLPFTFVGLDYMGPIQVAVGRRREKRYIALFTCLTTRAIHLEIVHSLSTDAAIMCLRRFIARRGTPHRILSDNGTAFVGANNQLIKIYQGCFGNECANHHISWKFIPPGAPNMGGAWERLVRTVKVALRALLNERVPKEEILLTVLLEAEALINSRPLTDVPCDPDAPEALTPFHFLIGSSSPYHPITVGNDDLLSRSDWRKSQCLADMFWNRWVKEYLPLIVPRRSPKNARALKFSLGDLVLISDGTLPRGTWPRGRISAIHPGRDGIVRVVEVTTRGGPLLRPVTKVVKLPVDINHRPVLNGSARVVEDVAE